MEAIHQGYLLCCSDASGDFGSQNLQKIYAVLTSDQLVCYSENPALQHFSKVNILNSFDLKYARVNDTTESNRPKSFEMYSTRDNLRTEFVCATNSVKFQWVKQLQVQTCSVAPVSNAKTSYHDNLNRDISISNEPAASRPTIRSSANGTGSAAPQGLSRLNANRNLAAKVLTPVPRLSYNTSKLDSTHGNLSASHDPSDSKITTHNSTGSGVIHKGVIDNHPKWIPNNFGNKQHSSLAVSPASTVQRAQSAGRIAPSAWEINQYQVSESNVYSDTARNREIQPGQIGKSPASAIRRQQAQKKADYDVLASRAAPTRSKSATPSGRTPNRSERTVFEVQTPRNDRISTPVANAGPTHDAAINNTLGDRAPPSRATAYATAPALDHSGHLMEKSMSDMTVSEIRAALLSMPAMVRESILDTPKNSQAVSARSTRRGSYNESPAYTPSTNLSHDATNVSSSMQEEYFNSRRRGNDQYDHFMGESYPAVGEFYPADYSSRQNSSNRHLLESQHHHQNEVESSAEEEEDDDDGQERSLREESRNDYNYATQHDEDGEEEVNRNRNKLRHEYVVQQEYDQRHLQRDKAEYSDNYQQEYGSYVSADEEGYFREDHSRGFNETEQKIPNPRHKYSQQEERAMARNSTEHSRSPRLSTAVHRGIDENVQGHIRRKEKLPEAAMRGGRVSPPARSRHSGAEASDRESLIPRRIDSSSRLGSSLRRIDTGYVQSDGYDSSVSPPAKSKNTKRATSTQRVPSDRQQGASRNPNRDRVQQAGFPQLQSSNRSASTGSISEKNRYLPEAERKQALDWSRKQAWDKKVRENFSGSPLRAASPAATPTTLKLKYRSFNNSVEKGFNSGLEGQRGSAQESQHKIPPHVPSRVEPDQTKKPSRMSALEKDTAVQEAMGAIARSRARAQHDGQEANKPKSKSDHISYSASTFSKIPESFFAFRNNRTGPTMDPGLSQSHEISGPKKSSPPAKPLTATAASPAVTTDSFIRSNQQMLAGYQARKSPERTERPAKRDERTMTNVAEWRRLTDWLTGIGMQRYIEVLRVNGVTKLSLVELMQPEDMVQIGITPPDIDWIHKNVTEFTNRTRSFSEQVLNRVAESTSPSPPTSHTESTSNQFLHTNTVASASPLVAATNVGVSNTVPPRNSQAQQSANPVRRPNVPPPHHLAKNGKEKLLTPFARRNLETASSTEHIKMADDLNPEPEEVLESVRIATEEHIFSDVREIRAELLRCFETGERELFFHAWKQVILYFPDDCNTLNPHRPSMYNAKQVIEFHLHLHFAVFPITHNQGKKAEKEGKLALRRYLESVMLTSELNSLNSLDAATPRSANDAVEKLSSPRSDESGLFLDTNLLNVTSNSITSPTTPFTRTREYAVYAGMVLVPDPQVNVAFQALFQPQWMQSLKERLGQFLTLVSPNVEIITAVSTAASSVVNVDNNMHNVEQGAVTNVHDGHDLSEDDSRAPLSVHSAHSKVRNYLEPALAATPALSQGRLDDFEIAFTSPIHTKNADSSSPLHTDIQIEPIDLTSPSELHISTKLIEEVVSPLEMSPSEADVPRKRMINTKLSDEGALSKLNRIASPVSAVSSVISQLTDDDYPRSSIGATTAALKFDEFHDGSVRGTAEVSVPERKHKLKPFSATPKSAMQSQVDMYNKLLKNGVGAKLDSLKENQLRTDLEPESAHVPSSDPVTSPPSFRTTRRVTVNVQNQSKSSSLNVGFGLKRRSSADPSTADHAQSLAAQVARYNKLLSAAPVENKEPLSDPTGVPNGMSEDTTEEISAAEAERVEEVLLEMQQIYSSSAEASSLPVPNDIDSGMHELGVIERKIEHHLEQLVPAEPAMEAGDIVRHGSEVAE